MTGHGGDGFLKFQDAEEITNIELADAFEQMWVKRRYLSTSNLTDFRQNTIKNELIKYQMTQQNIIVPFQFRYNEIFFMIDTCQAASMFQVIKIFMAKDKIVL